VERPAAAIPLLGIFVPKLIEMAIGGIAALLKKAGEDQTTQLNGSEVTDLYKADADMALHANEKSGAILGVWGVFADEDGRPTPPSDWAVRRLEAAGLVPVNSDIGIIFEGVIRRSADNSAFYVETRHFSVREFAGDRGGNERSFVATVAVTVPSATAEGDTIALGNIDFGRLKRRDSLISDAHPLGAFPRFRSNLMPWKQMSQAAKAAYDADVAAKTAAGKPYMPVSIRLTISETADGNKFLAKLGELLEGAKKEAAAELSKRILPEEIEKADAARAEAAEKLYIAELDAELEKRKAQKAYDAGLAADKPALRVELEKAIRKLERATLLRKAAGLPGRAPIPAN